MSPYRYTRRMLEKIITEYSRYLEAGCLRVAPLDADKKQGYGSPGWLRLLEKKADFDMALDSLGIGWWLPICKDAYLIKSMFPSLNKKQKVVISLYLGIEDYELESLHLIYDPPRLRSYAFTAMLRYLNMRCNRKKEENKK